MYVRTNKHRFIGPSFLGFNNEYISAYAKSAIKLTFLSPDTYTYVCVSGGKKNQFFGNFCVLTK